MLKEINKIKSMIYKSKSPKMDNSHCLDINQLDRLINKINCQYKAQENFMEEILEEIESQEKLMEEMGGALIEIRKQYPKDRDKIKLPLSHIICDIIEPLIQKYEKLKEKTNEDKLDKS